MNTLRSDRPPCGEYYVEGSWVRILVCGECLLHGRNGDLNPTEPCPRCGAELVDAVGRWERLSPRWRFWDNYGRWVVRGGEEDGKQ